MLEATTVIRVPPPGVEGGYIVAAVRVDGRLQAVRLDADPDAVPVPGTRVEPAGSVDGVPLYRPVG